MDNVIIRCENINKKFKTKTVLEDVSFENGIPVNEMTRGEYHGYGAKSIRRAVQKYEGRVGFSRKENWFVMKAVIPIT